MKSQNFEILRSIWPELAELGGFAEAYAHADPASALVKLRLFAENLTKDIYRDLRLPKPDQPTFVDLLNNQSFSAITPKVVLDKLHALRIHGNKAAHGEAAKLRETLSGCSRKPTISRAGCLFSTGKGMPRPSLLFQPPPTDDGTDSKGQLKREKRHVLEKLAAQEAQMDALLRELEAARQAAATAEKKAEEIRGFGVIGREAAANVLAVRRGDNTRTRLIDSLLASAGWNVGSGPRAARSRSAKRSRSGISRPTTGLGYADYVLWDDNGNPLAVIEAKKTSVDPERGRHQAKRYADGLEKDARAAPGHLLHQRLRHLDLGRRARA